MFKVLVSETISNEAEEYLTNNGAIIKRGSGTDEASVIKDISDCDAVIVRLLKVSKKVIDAAHKLKIIAKHGVGCDSIDVEYAKEKGIAVLNTPGANSICVAEHTVGLMLNCSHQITRSYVSYKNQGFNSRLVLNVSEISNKVVGLIGCGRIAKEVASILHNGFNMRIVGFDPYISNKEKQTIIDYVDSLDELLQMSDYVSLHIPLTSETRHIISYPQLLKMKSSAYLINTSRGELINNDDLLKAVNSGVILGAGLDVTFPEPLVDLKLLNNPKIIVTQHIGASSEESMARVGIATAKNLICFFKDGH